MESTDYISDLPVNKSVAQPLNPTNQSDVSTEAIQSEPVLRAAFSIIAGSAFVFNLMFCVVLLKKPAMMKKPYNTLLFNLAITDLFTGEISYSSYRPTANVTCCLSFYNMTNPLSLHAKLQEALK